ncbi:MAG TPA: L-lactate permease, partial [Terriglobia bacterium]|nr:L-lactate permease [Terriglobia bacterium]
MTHPWHQPVDPLHALPVSALVAAVPLVLLLVLLGVLRRSAWLSAACALAATLIVAGAVWGMPLRLALSSAGFG